MRKFTKTIFSTMLLLVLFNAVMAQKKRTPLTTVTNERSAIQKIDPELLNNTQQDKKGYSDMEQANPTYRIVSVEIKCTVTDALLKVIANNRGKVSSSSVENNNISAKVPLFALEKIAASSDVRYIGQSVVKPISGTNLPNK
jgi:hypothetical protein